jgi:pimeloyl-ACP methyl ester carboxylesterase
MMVAYDDEGSGPAVVLLHSGVCDRRMWDAQTSVFATSYRLIRPDLRGFGETPLPAKQFSFADDVVALLDHLHVERAAFVGSSLGGRVALEVAVTSSERVTSLILLCPALQGAGTTSDADAFVEGEDQQLSRGEVAAAVELNVSTWLGPDATAECRDLVREMQRHAFEVQLTAEAQDPAPQLVPVEVDLSQVSVPTLVVSGGRDMDHFQNVAQHLASSITGAHLQRLPWAAHLPSLERPDEVNDLVRDFLATTTAE